jgi:ferritin-like metal-binding protein YciE
MKKIQSFYLYSYRFIGFIFLVGLITSIIWYGFSIVFFIGNSSWSVPLILSPHQEKVMSHLEHVLSLEHEVSRNTAELTAAKQALKHKQSLLKLDNELKLRMIQSMASQSEQYEESSQIFNKLSHEKKTTIEELKQLAEEVAHKESVVDKELEAGLITEQEALAAHLTGSKIRSGLLDAEASVEELSQRAVDLANAANTLNGSASNLMAMDKVIKKTELENQIAQIKSDIFSLKVSIADLEKNVSKKKEVLKVLTNSPYILATRASTTVAFVPYRNLAQVKVGAPVYSCLLDMLFCHQSGRVSRVYKAEEYSKHPIFKSDMKGQFIGIEFKQRADGQKKLLFLNSKPLFV